MIFENLKSQRVSPVLVQRCHLHPALACHPLLWPGFSKDLGDKPRTLVSQILSPFFCPAERQIASPGLDQVWFTSLRY